MRTRHILAAVATLALLVGCDQGTTSSSAPDPAPTTAAAKPLDARKVLTKLKAADVGLSGGTVQNEDTDPNNLLGRPSGYTSRASADLPGGNRDDDVHSINRGLVIEAFASVEDADRRAQYIQGILKGAPLLGSEYHYRADGGRVLVRVSGLVKPSRAAKVEAAVADL
ncbi:hypothetical protein [Verrucosispora sp. TAA-831]|uniref:hypothetical protein n=1 Tax=Verrucosispora sp. TAA-831 TaxID=3422227 RepID=UPI003D6FF7C8